tara:strand:+ start:720 stop:1025 length:306 start_codon:yes stop_codon:yes gene_type:complete
MKPFHGWTNAETDIANGFIRADRAAHAHFLRVSREMDIGELAEAIGDYYGEVLPEMPSIYAHLLCASLARVNWRELAEEIAADAEFAADNFEAHAQAEGNA